MQQVLLIYFTITNALEVAGISIFEAKIIEQTKLIQNIIIWIFQNFS
jgi:hypothetical protein